MDDIKVSIITICRNSAQDISKTLRSVLNQSYDNIEYIIVDGKSEDKIGRASCRERVSSPV